MIRTPVRSLLAAVVMIASVAAASSPASALSGCADDTDAVFDIPANPAGITGKIAFPSEPGDDLAVFAHGYSHDSDSWVTHIQRTAAQGAVAFAVDYRGTHEDAEGNVRGWYVKEGAQDMVDVTRALLAGCEGLSNVILYGVSMGGNSSGLAVAMGATRTDGTPLFDYWVAGEPAANVIETYVEARTLAPALGGFVQRALEDIEAEHGGPIEENLASYVDGTVLYHAATIADNLKGVAIVHAFDDGTVPYDQGRELATALRAAGLPTDMYNVLRRETDGSPDGGDNSTITENVFKPLFAGAGQVYPEPFAGHGTESSQKQIVVQTGLELVFDLMHGESVPSGGEYIVDGETGTTKVL